MQSFQKEVYPYERKDITSQGCCAEDGGEPPRTESLKNTNKPLCPSNRAAGPPP